MSQINVNTIANASGTSAATIDGSGNLSITGKMTQPANPAFIVTATQSSAAWVTITSGTDYDVTFNTERVDRGNNFDTSTYQWTAPIDCLMMFGVQLYMDGATANYTRIRFYENSSIIHEKIADAPEVAIPEGALQSQVLLDVTAGRTYQWKLYKDATTPQVYYPVDTDTSLRFCYCWGYMVA